MAQSVIIIPARYKSSRFPGKPLTIIAGKTMLQRTCEVATYAAKQVGNCDVVVATDDARIEAHAKELGYQVVMTPESCPTGTDRSYAAVKQLGYEPEYVINLQGDAPVTPPHFIVSMLQELKNNKDVQLVTPVVQLNWDELDNLRERKKERPFSGTTAILGDKNNVLWFSKNIIPGLRKEDGLRQSDAKSPVYAHIGLYGFSNLMLQTYVNLEQTHYEQLEELEQLRVLENGLPIRAVVVEYGEYPVMSGVDTKADAERAEALISEFGELIPEEILQV